MKILSQSCACCVAALLVAAASKGQEVLWTQTHGGPWSDDAHAAARTADGGYILTGGSQPSLNSKTDVFLVKTDAAGAVQWTRTFGGPGAQLGRDVLQTPDGGFLIAGMKEESSQVFDSFLLRTDGSGNLLWERTYDTGQDDRAHGLCPTPDGGYVVAGQAYFGDWLFGDYDVYVFKTDARGNLVWKTFFAYPGDGNDVAVSVCGTSDGGFAVAGQTHGGGIWDAYLLKLDGAGNVTWTRTYGGPSSDDSWDVRETSDGGLILVGTGASPVNWVEDLMLVRTDAVGNVVWKRLYGSQQGPSPQEKGRAVIELWDGGFVAVGTTNSYSASSDAFVVRTDADGNELWTQILGGYGPDDGTDVVLGQNGEIVLVGSDFSEATRFDAFIAALQDHVGDPVVYCTAKLNSCLTLPSIGFSGLPSAANSSGFTVSAERTKALRAGLLIYTDSGRGDAPFHGGVLCLNTSPLRRSIPVIDTSGTPGLCDGVLAIDMNAFAAGSLGGNPLPSLRIPGTRINCQFWGRDTVANGSLLSDALEYTVKP